MAEIARRRSGRANIGRGSPLPGTRRGSPLLRGAAALSLLAGTLTACGGSGGTPTLTWYVNPDNGGQAKLASECTQASGGKYKIKTSILPNGATDQREQLVRRLAAKDSGLDLMSLDPVFVAEAANAGFLRPFTDAEVPQFTNGVFPAAVESAKWNGKLYAAPFWANTQLLWYRKSAAQKAGVDPTSANFTWDQMIDGAVKSGTTVAMTGNKYEGYMVWINALVTSAGGTVLTDPQKGSDAKVTLDNPAGRQAARIIRKLATSKAASPTLSTDIEDQARNEFNAGNGGFMVNWPYIYAADLGDAESGVIPKSVPADIGWAKYPQVVAGQPSKPPFGGIELGIGAYTKHDAEAVAAAQCITSEPHMKEYMLSEGNPGARPAIFDDAEVVKKFPMAALIRDSINAAAPRPITPYYPDVSGGIQSKWHPPVSVNPVTTPKVTDEFVPKVLRDQRLL